MRACLPVVLLFLSCAAGASTATKSLGIAAPNGESTIAYDMNAAGQVAAVLEDEEGNQRAVLFEKGKVTPLVEGGKGYSDAKAINPDGKIIGSAQNENGNWRAFLYQRGSGMRDLGTLGGPSSYGMAINDLGHAVGFADTLDGKFRAFLHDGRDGLLDLGTLGGSISYASGMNNLGQVVGTAATRDEYRHAFVYDAGRGMVDLGTLGGRQSAAMAINDAGMIVGASETADRKWHAFMHDGKKMIDLGKLVGPGSSFATDINSAGHVVGTVLRGEERLSFVYRNGVMSVHRGGKGLHLTNAINDRELVVGATFNRRMDAATMFSNAVPVVESGGMRKSMYLALISILVAAGCVWYRRGRGHAKVASFKS